MGELAERRDLLVTARAALLDDTDPELRGVPRHVAASWRRSVAGGVDPSGVVSTYHPDLDLGSRLVRSARPVIEQLTEQLSDLPVCVALTDDRARLVVRSDTSSWIGRIADAVYFAQGFGYAEGSVGTNGVGTALESGESVHIVGSEHFVESLQPYACAGAPVRDPLTGRVEGVLDISCLSEHSSPILHSLVRSAAARIQGNLLADRSHDQQALFDAYTRVETRSRHAVLALGRRTVMTNALMQTLLDAGDLVALQDHVRFLMARRSVVDEAVDLPSGTQVRLRGSAVTAGGDVVGMVVVVAHAAGPAPRRPGSPAPARSARTGSTSPAWSAAGETVAAALRAGTSIVVVGEPGAGRCTLLTDLHARTRDDGRVVAIAAEQLAAAPCEVAERIVRAAPEVLPVLRDVDRVPAAAARELLRGLALGPSRVLAATAADPAAADHALLALFHRSAAVPPLRNRAGDLPALATALLAELAPHRDVRLSREALRVLSRYGWPGNVRQLKDALAAGLRRRPAGHIEAADLPEYCQSTPRSALRPVDEAERDAIVGALRAAGGNRSATAAALGLARSTLYRKIRQYGITA